MGKRRPIPRKPVDLGYCFRCANFIGGFRRGEDFCKYDGKMLVQADGIKFKFACARYNLHHACCYNYG